MDKFLNFWSHHNVSIIETLIGTVLLISIYVAWKSLFSKDSGAIAGDSVHVDTTQIEQTLQKILENQVKIPAAASAPAPAPIDLSSLVPTDGTAIPEEFLAKVAAAQAEVQRLASEVESKNQQVTLLQQQVAEAEKKAAEAGASGGASPAPGGGVDTSALEAKIKDLESRLEEYEIISEDIADISKYKEENAQLKEEIARLKEQLANAGTASAPGIALDPALDIPSDVAALMEKPAEVSSEEPTPEVAAAPIEEASKEAIASAPSSEPAPEPTPEPAPEVANMETAAPDILSDDLMAEFEAAVAQQQSGELKNEAPAGDAATEPSKEAAASEVVQAKNENAIAETEELIGEFESFIKKS